MSLEQDLYSEDSHDKNYKTFLCDYFYKGEKWSLEIKALSHQEAEERMRNIVNGEIVGELIVSIPLMPKQNWFARLRKYLG